MAQRGSFGAVDIIADMKNFTGGRFKGIDLNALAERAKPKRSFHSVSVDSHSIKNKTSMCTHPYRVYTKSVVFSGDNPLDYSVPLLASQMMSIFVINQFLQFMLGFLGMSPIVSYILGGIILGDTDLGLKLDKYYKKLLTSNLGKFLKKGIKFLNNEDVDQPANLLHRLFPLRGSGSIGMLASIGFMLFEFLLGVKMDPRMMHKPGKKAAIIGIVSFIVPLLLGFSATFTLKSVSAGLRSDLEYDGKHIQRAFLYIATVQSMTTFPVVASLLTELKILNSELGRLALSSSMVSEACNVLITMILIQFKIFDSKNIDSLKSISKMKERADRTKGGMCSSRSWLCASISSTLFLVAVFTIVRQSVTWLIKITPKKRPVKRIFILVILLGVIVTGTIGSMLGQHLLFGPFIFGLAIPDGPPLGTALVSQFESLTMGLLLPLFLTVSGLRTDIPSLRKNVEEAYALPILVITCSAGKILATMIVCLYFRMPKREALALGVIMSAKGIVELSTYNVWRDSEVLNDSSFTLMILAVLVIASIVPCIVRYLYDPAKKYAGYDRRTILHSKAYSEFKVLACISEDENVPTMIKLLSASTLTTESPIRVFALHLVELVGRTAPIFVSHNSVLDRSAFNNTAQSEHIVNAFRNYEQFNAGLVIVEAFTAVSPYATIHNDICTLAFKQCTSLVIVPFHKKWAVDGTMASENIYLRAMNKKVLETAPCSVGILVDRGQSSAVTSSSARHSTASHICVLFLGGADDREALAYAKRMSYNIDVYITVVRLLVSEEKDLSSWEGMLDAEVVKDFELHTMSNRRITYKEEVVRDGEQTAWVIHSIIQKNDLIVVGRRNGIDSPLTSGLTEWSECPELGVIGDMLASSDVKVGVSVLVIQQMGGQ